MGSFFMPLEQTFRQPSRAESSRLSRRGSQRAPTRGFRRRVTLWITCSRTGYARGFLLLLETGLQSGGGPPTDTETLRAMCEHYSLSMAATP
ncbi:hypothetical protein AGIG_G5248 [Arapaima gigas]